MEEWKATEKSKESLFQAIVFIEGYSYHSVETILQAIDAALANHQECVGGAQFLSSEASLDVRAKAIADFRYNRK